MAGEPGIEPGHLERLGPIGRFEAEDLAEEREPRLECAAERGCATEPVAFALEREVGVRDRLPRQGGSAGGYTTLAALAFRDVFAAGISLYGIGDLELLETDNHKFESHYDHRLVGPYPETAALYRERSPSNFPDRFSSPVLILQGLDDKVVPPSQAESIVAALSRKGIPYA